MTTRIDLPEKLDTSMAEGLARRLAAAGQTDLSIEGQRVESLGALCAQLLWAARARARAQGTAFALLPSERMRDDLALLGMQDLAPSTSAPEPGDTP